MSFIPIFLCGRQVSDQPVSNDAICLHECEAAETSKIYNILVNAEPVDALCMIVHRAAAEARGRQPCERLMDLIPRHLFKIPI